MHNILQLQCAPQCDVYILPHDMIGIWSLPLAHELPVSEAIPSLAQMQVNALGTNDISKLF